jgi:hypothetical protein
MSISATVPRPGTPEAFIATLLDHGTRAAEQGDVATVLLAWSDIRTASDAMGVQHPKEELRAMMCKAYRVQTERLIDAGRLADTLDSASEHVRWGGDRSYLPQAAARAYERAGALLVEAAQLRRLKASDVGALVTAVVAARQMGLDLRLDPVVTGIVAAIAT